MAEKSEQARCVTFRLAKNDVEHAEQGALAFRIDPLRCVVCCSSAADKGCIILQNATNPRYDIAICFTEAPGSVNV